MYPVGCKKNETEIEDKPNGNIPARTKSRQMPLFRNDHFAQLCVKLGPLYEILHYVIFPKERVVCTPDELVMSEFCTFTGIAHSSIRATIFFIKK